MPNDGGTVAVIEQFIADTLAALTYNNVAVFKTAEVWRFQIGAGEGGIEAFKRYEPFAFVKYQPPTGDREGDYDLRQVLRFAVVIGVESRSAGAARTGDSNNLGTSKIRDLVIDALDGQHPGESTNCDPIYYRGELEAFDSPTRHAIEMYFEANMITI